MFGNVWQWLYDLTVSTTIRDSTYAFPILECVHLYSMVFLIALVAAFDLKLLGFALGRQAHSSIAGFSRKVLRWIWIPFVGNALTGTLLFATEAPDYSNNWAFMTKMLLIFMGATYHLVLLLKATQWNELFVPTVPVKLMTALAFLTWPGVIVASRWIAYA